MYVFPGQTHLLSQPIHQLVSDERQLDWLKDEKDHTPNKGAQYFRRDARFLRSEQNAHCIQ
jgi:hypothetical protein